MLVAGAVNVIALDSQLWISRNACAIRGKKYRYSPLQTNKAFIRDCSLRTCYRNAIQIKARKELDSQRRNAFHGSNAVKSNETRDKQA